MAAAVLKGLLVAVALVVLALFGAFARSLTSRVMP